MHRIGIGYDLHRLIRRRKLILGGITIPYAKGLLGHSDADVLIHAICDALLGASSRGDIGEHFPDCDPAYKNISSVKLLKKVAQRLRALRYSINNIDAVIVAEKPSLVSYKKKISRNIAQILKLPSKRVNIKAASAEKLGPIGRGQAISAYAIALIKKK